MLLAIIISASSLNSLITCLHIPQGKTSSWSATIAIAFIFFFPSDIALNIAVLSAQFVAPYDEFSLLCYH